MLKKEFNEKVLSALPDAYFLKGKTEIAVDSSEYIPFLYDTIGCRLFAQSDPVHRWVKNEGTGFRLLMFYIRENHRFYDAHVALWIKLGAEK